MIDLSETTSCKNSNGDDAICYSDGTIVAVLSNGNIVTELSDGTIKTEYTDGTVTYEYPDGTFIKIFPENNYKEIRYSNGIHIVEDEDGTILAIEDFEGEMTNFTNLDCIFRKFRDIDNTSETIRYLMEAYRLYYRNELALYTTEQYNSYLMEYIAAKVVYDNDTKKYNIINEDTLYNDIFNALDELQQTDKSNIVSDDLVCTYNLPSNENENKNENENESGREIHVEVKGSEVDV